MPYPDPVVDGEQAVRPRSSVCYQRKNYVEFECNNLIEDVFGNILETQFS